MTTADLTTLRQHLLDLLCQLAYQEGDFISLQAAQFLLHQWEAGNLHPQGALAIGRSYPSRQMSRQLLD